MEYKRSLVLAMVVVAAIGFFWPKQTISQPDCQTYCHEGTWVDGPYYTCMAASEPINCTGCYVMCPWEPNDPNYPNNPDQGGI